MKSFSYLQRSHIRFVGLIFLISAGYKLYSIDSFEIYIYSFEVIKFNWASFFARGIISLELSLGLMLVLRPYNKLAITFSIITLTLFSFFIISLILRNNEEHCHCFGDFEISHSVSIIKNLFLIGLLLIQFPRNVIKLKYDKVIIASSLIAGLLIPVLTSPPDCLYIPSNGLNTVAFEEKTIKDYINNNDSLTKGKKVLCFFGTGCRFCRLASKKISVISKKSGNYNSIIYIFWGNNDSVKNFFETTNSVKFQYFFMNPKRFLTITKGSMPLIFLLENVDIKESYGYRDIKDEVIIDFLTK